MAQVFISHAKDDIEIARELENMLFDKSVSTFIAINIQPGNKWEEELKSEIYASDELLLIWSPNSMESDWVMLEVGAAWAMDKRIRTAVINGDLKTAPEPIREFQAVDIKTHLAREKLVESIAGDVKKKGKNELLVGNWHEYHYSMDQGAKKIIRHDLWQIERNWKNQLTITTKTISPDIPDLKYKGIIEEIKGCLLANVSGIDHDEVFQVRFPKLIPNSEGIMVLTVVGEDFNYKVRFFLNLLSRKELTFEEATKLLQSNAVTNDYVGVLPH
jgi:hypothetical protein